MSSGDLEKSLREDIESYVNQRLNDLRDEIARLQSQFNEGFARLSERVDEALKFDDTITVAVSDHLRHARNEGIETAAEESPRSRVSSDIALIKAAVEELEQQRTQADILNLLVNRAAAFAPRVAFFVLKNERATGWRARGLEGTVGDDTVREISLSLSSDTVLGKVARTRTTWSGSPGSHAEDNSVYGRFNDEPPQRIVAIPMIARDKVVAVLYADTAEQDADAVQLEALETLVRVASMSVELLASQRQPSTATSASDAASASEKPTRESANVTRQTEHAPEAAPEPQAAADEQRYAASHEAAPEARPSSFETGSQAEAAPQPEPSFAAGAPAAQTPDAQTETAPQGEAAPSSVRPLGTSRRYGAMDMDFPVEVGEDEKRYHNEARRFARLLVSEIKLYNEQKVREGRDSGDLYERLREDIDRSRQMYDKRVRPEVSGRYDYFHHELVQMLAEGDTGKLGAGYPGANDVAASR